MSFFSNWVNKIQELFVPRITQTVEAIEVEVAAVEAKAKVAVAKVEKVVKTEAPKVKAVKNAKAEIAGKRTRKGGKFVKDDPSTPDVNEAFKDGKAPAKKAVKNVKAATKKKPNLKVEK
jgi:hypothetical protein